MKNINFVNVVELNKQNPDSFKLFDNEMFIEIKPLDNVRVLFNDERFWITVLEIDLKNKIIIGNVGNDLVMDPNILKFDDKVKLSFDNVMDIFFKNMTLNKSAMNEISSNIPSIVQNNLRTICDSCNEPYFINTYLKYK